MSFIIIELALASTAAAAFCWAGWQLLRQNGRILLRLDALEKQLEELRAERAQARASPQPGPLPEGEGEDAGREGRFGSRSLANSKIKRDGLKAGTVAPEFRLPRLDGGELALSDLRGKFVLLVFSSPHCGPCNILAPKLEKFHRKLPQLELVMISQREPAENRAKVKEHGLTFPVALQKQWEVSRDYAYFATPVAYLIDRNGLILEDVAVGVDAILDLMSRGSRLLRTEVNVEETTRLRRIFGWPRFRGPGFSLQKPDPVGPIQVSFRSPRLHQSPRDGTDGVLAESR